MKKIDDAEVLFEEWLENMRKEFHIKKFKDFRKEMYVFVNSIKEEKDITKISRLVEKYMEKK